jgi:2-polyprenyl-6-methoxyphenol hydroxylase-like FAD-dependent oxidoreductase
MSAVQILIAGAGPAGASLAYLLARRGIAVNPLGAPDRLRAGVPRRRADAQRIGRPCPDGP